MKGICVIGNFMTEKPNDLALNALKKIIQLSIDKGFLSANYTLKGHRDQIQFGGTVTECPGK